jgi:hypothetical protein
LRCIENDGIRISIPSEIWHRKFPITRKRLPPIDVRRVDSTLIDAKVSTDFDIKGVDTMSAKGVLLVLMQPPSTLEEEFNAWYDSEHIPERLAVPGVETGLRFISTGAAPRYLAIYDLADDTVLDTEEYLRVAGDRSSPWTKRVCGRVKIYRSAGPQVYPGQELTVVSSRMQIVRFRGLDEGAEAAVIAGMRKAFEGRGSTLQIRVFAYPTDGKVDFIGCVSASLPDDAAPDPLDFGGLAASIDLFNTYTPY